MPGATALSMASETASCFTVAAWICSREVILFYEEPLWGNTESDPTTFEERLKLSGNGIIMPIKKLMNDGIPPQVITRSKKIQIDMDIKNLTGAGSLAPVGNISLDYKILNDSTLRLDLISGNV